MEAWRGKDTGGSSFRRSEEFFQRQRCTEQTSKQQTARGINRGSNRREIWSCSSSSSRELVGVVVIYCSCYCSGYCNGYCSG
ncbi:hypothetical protein I7I48_05030 [Histoplasma ohiense]|nr:hypothetical protein I7I48_05030 [Histoplasma ohiense (nom. inval.)]